MLGNFFVQIVAKPCQAKRQNRALNRRDVCQIHDIIAQNRQKIHRRAIKQIPIASEIIIRKNQIYEFFSRFCRIVHPFERLFIFYVVKVVPKKRGVAIRTRAHSINERIYFSVASRRNIFSMQFLGKFARAQTAASSEHFLALKSVPTCWASDFFLCPVRNRERLFRPRVFF